MNKNAGSSVHLCLQNQYFMRFYFIFNIPGNIIIECNTLSWFHVYCMIPEEVKNIQKIKTGFCFTAFIETAFIDIFCVQLAIAAFLLKAFFILLSIIYHMFSFYPVYFKASAFCFYTLVIYRKNSMILIKKLNLTRTL